MLRVKINIKEHSNKIKSTPSKVEVQNEKSSGITMKWEEEIITPINIFLNPIIQFQSSLSVKQPEKFGNNFLSYRAADWNHRNVEIIFRNFPLFTIIEWMKEEKFKEKYEMFGNFS